MASRLSFRLLIGLVMLAAGLGRAPSPALAANGVVGTGTPASCTEAAFNTVLSTVQGSGGGTITFDCGPAAHTILFTALKPINSAVTVDGGGRITLSGGDTTSLFTVNFGDSLTLRGLTLTRAGGAGAAIGNFGRLDVIDSQLTNNAATSGPGGAISSIGTAALTNTLVISNTAAQFGGGISNGGTLTISGGQITGNRATTTGGGLYNAGTATLTGVQIMSNRATTDGGGIYSKGTLTMTQSSLTNNIAADEGGGLYGENVSWISTSVVQSNSSMVGGGIGHFGGTLTLNQVLVADNGNETDPGGNADRGGGVYLSGLGVFDFTAVTVWQNRATLGGGIALADGSLTLLNSTLSDNRAQFGGGLHTSGGVTSIQQVTFTANLAIGVPANPSRGSGGGIYWQAGTIDLKNSLLSGNRRFAGASSDNCYSIGTVPAAISNLSSDVTCGFGAGRDNVTLPLGPLQPNGGFTPTHLLPQGSPAIDAGINTGCPALDQRGQARPVGGACDVGAIEARPADFVTRLYLPALQK